MPGPGTLAEIPRRATPRDATATSGHPRAGSALRFVRRPEWWLASALVGAALTVRFFVRPTPVTLSFEIYFELASAFTASVLGGWLLVLGERLLAALPFAERRRGRRIWRAATLVVATTFFVAVHPPRATPLTRLLEAGALSLTVTVALLVLFLPAAGLLRLRDLRAVGGEVLGRWLPLLAYLVSAGPLMAATLVSTPRVLDPVLWRMDLSLGFSPSEAIFAWAFEKNAVRLMSTWGYPLLGLLLAGVAARLHLAGAVVHGRRCLLALTLVATGGLICYQFVPAIGPLHAFPQLFDEPADTPARQTQAAAQREAIVTGPDRIAGSLRHPRNVMPSLHTAFTLVALAAAWNWRRKFFWSCLPLGAVQIATALTLCVHYLVDLIAAVPLAILCWALADAGVRRFPGDDPAAEALPPLAPNGTRPGALPLALSLTCAPVLLFAWGWFAPLPAWLAWTLVGLIAGAPAWLALGFYARPGGREQVRARPASPSRRSLRLLKAAVFCSGGVALVLEQIYEKYLSTLLGASRPASTIVLAVYFTGLALGAWLCPKNAAGAPRRLALLELFIAAWAALVGVTFFACDRWLGHWLAAAGSSAVALTGMRTAIAVLWILPPTLAMGAQLPTLAAVLAGQGLRRGRTLTRFYSINLAGACAFTFAAPVLFTVANADGALWIIAALGAAIGLLLWFGLPRPRFPVPALPRSAAPTLPPAGTPARRPALAMAFTAGFGFFALEVVWFHLISAVCGASTFSFSILLAVVLLGLALGGRQVARREPSLAALLGWLVVALALGNALWPWAGPLMAQVQDTQRLEWFWAGELVKTCVVACVVLPAAALAGQIFPGLLRQFEPVAETSRIVGALCTANVIGCVTGALVAGFGLIPAFGAERTLLGLALAAAAGWLWLAARGARHRPTLASGALGLLLLLALPRWNRLQLTGGYGVYLAPPLARDATLAFFREDFASGFVTVTEHAAPDRAAPVKTLRQNGKFDADDAGEMRAQVAFGLVAGLHAPQLDHALVIGCGSGQTASVIARLGFAHVDIAELSAAHLAAARAQFGHINAGVLDRPDVAVHLEDGRNHLLRTATRYDVIQVELTSVWFAGATNLYSREFYALARERLAPGGVLVQWIQLHHLTPREIASILATAQAEFPHVSVWQAGQQACLLASDRAPAANAAAWEKWSRSPALLDERILTGGLTPEKFAATQLVPAARLRSLLAATPTTLNTDRNRWLEFQTPKYYLSRRNHREENLRWLGAKPN